MERSAHFGDVRGTRANAQQGATQPPRKKRYIQRDEKIQKLFERFQNGESSLAEYLAVRHQTRL